MSDGNVVEVVNEVHLFELGGDLRHSRTIIGVQLLDLPGYTLRSHRLLTSSRAPVISFDRDSLIEPTGKHHADSIAVVEKLMTMLKSDPFKTGIMIKDMKGHIDYEGEDGDDDRSNLGIIGNHSVIQFSENLKFYHSFPFVSLANAVNLLDVTVVATKVVIRPQETPEEWFNGTKPFMHVMHVTNEELRRMSQNPYYTDEAYIVYYELGEEFTETLKDLMKRDDDGHTRDPILATGSIKESINITKDTELFLDNTLEIELSGGIKIKITKLVVPDTLEIPGQLGGGGKRKREKSKRRKSKNRKSKRRKSSKRKRSKRKSRRRR